MTLIKYRSDNAEAAVGYLEDDLIHEVPGVASISEALRLSAAELASAVESRLPAHLSLQEVTLLAPVDGRMEVWAAGVTYRRSREARMTESEHEADVYSRVYEADRPELFFKSAAWRVRGHGQTIAVREDSPVNVPEPELALVVNTAGDVVGYSVCNDVSSRSIEGDNPLYLPQAKVYLGGCAVGPGIRLAGAVGDATNLGFSVQVTRGRSVVWEDSASTSGLARTFGDLVGYLRRSDTFPDGVILSTGTCLVPDLPFTLEPKDTVSITVEQIGTLSNTVVSGLTAMWESM